VYGGDYAYVIREPDVIVPRQPRTRTPEPAHDQAPAPVAEPQQRQQPPQPQQPPQSQQQLPHQQPSRNPAANSGYGPGDPAYGPPAPDWLARHEAARRQAAEDELRLARGAFEPLGPDHIVAEPPGFDGDDYQAPAIPGPAGPPDQEAEHEVDMALSGDGPPLEQIKDIYQAAEKIGDERLDRHFEQLLDRQRQLIRDYFAGAGSREPAGPGREAGAAAAGRQDAGDADGGRNRRDTGDLNLGDLQRSRR
jgi:hypothetical protein